MMRHKLLPGLALFAAAVPGETPVSWDRGHVEMDLIAPGQSVIFFTIHGRDCIAIGDSAGGTTQSAPTIALSCDWPAR